jgi:hypothetical protein
LPQWISIGIDCSLCWCSDYDSNHINPLWIFLIKPLV